MWTQNTVTWGKGYIRGSPCLNYSFDMLISLISNLGLYNWPYRIYFTCYLFPAHVCLYSWHNFQYMLLTRIYRYTYVYLCMPLDIHHTTHWGVLTPLNLHVQILKLWACRFFWLLIRHAQRKHEFSADRLEPHPSRPPCSSPEFFFCNREHLLFYSYCISLCILAFAPIDDIIFL